MATKVGKIERKKGKMYFVKANGDVMETTMNRSDGKKGRHFCKVQPEGHQAHAKPVHHSKKKAGKHKHKATTSKRGGGVRHKLKVK